MHTKQKAFSYILFPLFSAGDGIPAFSFCINRQKFLFSQKQRAAKECLELFDGTLFSSSCQGDLNPRPPPYQGDALPTAPRQLIAFQQNAKLNIHYLSLIVKLKLI